MALTATAALAAAFVLSAIPVQAWAAVDCATVLAAPDPGLTGADADNDGFTDFQECGGITLANKTPFPSCVASTGNPTPPSDRRLCLHPDTKDLFAIYAPAAASLLPAGYKPFDPGIVYGVTFTGFEQLFVTVHQITPAQAFPDRSVTSASPQKAVKVAESLDTSGTILGYCQWGTPLGLDGCTIYTQRILNFVSSTCGTLPVVTGGGAASTLDQVFLAYAKHAFLHEVGHSTGGLAATYNSSYGGYHYKCGAGSRMEQCVTYSTKGGKCSFKIAPGWNTSLDPAAVKLK